MLTSKKKKKENSNILVIDDKLQTIYRLHDYQDKFTDYINFLKKKFKNWF